MTIPYRGTPPIEDELLSAYLDGQVSPDERASVEAAIAGDPTVRARLTDLRATVALLRSLPQPVPRRTFILTPELAASIRPVHVPWLTRFFPTIAAVGAVAAVLCLALIGGDLATGGFATKHQQQVKLTRPAAESVGDATVTRVTVGATGTTASLTAAPTSVPVAAAATNAPAPAQAAAPAASGGSSANSTASRAITPTATLPLPPTAAANVQAPPPAVPAPPSGGAVVTKETHRVPVALVRAGEILLALLAIAGVTLAVLGRRRKAART